MKVPREATPNGASDSVDIERSTPLYLSYANFAPQRSSSPSRTPIDCTPHDCASELRRSINPIVPIETQVHFPLPRLFRNQTPPSVVQTSLPIQARAPKQPHQQDSSGSLLVTKLSNIPTKDQETRARAPLHQLQNHRDTFLFDNGHHGSGAMEDVRKQIVEQYVIGVTRKFSCEAAARRLPDSELDLAYGNRRLSSLTFQSAVAPRAPGEETSHDNSMRRGNLPLHVSHAGVKNVSTKSEGKLYTMYNPISSVDRPAKDLEAPSTSTPFSKRRDSKSPDKFHEFLKSFVSTRSDERSKSSQKTAKSHISAKWALVLPSRRSSSAIHSNDRTIAPVVELHHDLENARMARFLSISACLCTMMIVAVVFFVIFVPKRPSHGKPRHIEAPHLTAHRTHPTGDDPFATASTERFPMTLAGTNLESG